MNNNDIKDKLTNIISEKPSDWLKKAKLRKQNRKWLDRSAKIAINILKQLRIQGLSQKDLADKIGVTPQYINKIVKGQENLSLQTIGEIEKALGISLLTISEGNNTISDNKVIYDKDLSNSFIFTLNYNDSGYNYILEKSEIALHKVLLINKIIISEQYSMVMNNFNESAAESIENMQLAA